MTSFRERIRAKRGEISARLFENASTGLPLDLYWSVYVECEPIDWENGSWATNVECEWLTWPVRRWGDLDGMNLSSVTRSKLVECSFYFADHHPVLLAELSLRRVADTTRFLTTLRGQFDLHGFGELDEQRIPLALSCELEFSGVIVVPGNLSPQPKDAEQARLVLEAFLSTEELLPPRWDRFRYLLEPR